MAKQDYIDFDFDFKDRFYDKVVEFGGNVKLLRNRTKKPAGRILFVLDHLPTEDIESGELLSGHTDSVFHSLADLAYDYYKSEYAIDEFDFVVINFNCCKTYGMSEDWQRDANAEFGRRLNAFIDEYQPTLVHTFGREPHIYLNSEKITEAKDNAQNWYGVPVNTQTEYKGRTTKFIHIASLSINSILNPRGDVTNTSNLLGYLSRNMVTTLDAGKLRYAIPFISSPKKRNYEIHYVDTIAKVKKCLKLMASKPYVAVDTETESLARVTNKIQTVQFCCDGKNAYTIPIYHKDTPFTSAELKIIKRLMRQYFETKNKNVYQIYANAQFDLNVMRAGFNIRFFKSDIWDVQAGEFALDENHKFVHSVTGKGYYSLGNLAMQYGCDSYLTVKFGKENRATISEVPLNEDVLEYCSLDVVIPWWIMKRQWEKAKDIDYKLYKHVVGKQISDQIHTFSCLESTGAYTDIEYLFKLQHPTSPINIEIQKLEALIYTSDEVAEVNKRIANGKNMPSKGLFGKVEAPKAFDLSKEEHKQMLFFDVMELEPVETSKKKKRENGQELGKIDKHFQNKYKDENEIVKAFSDLQKAYKLRNAYVRSLLKLWANNDDFKSDRRIRPNYGYRGVVTGRTSASDPNLQQIPSRSELGKQIKRLFSSRPGKLLIKVDYSAHEVRGWSIISGDRGVADLFQTGADLRQRFRYVPDPYITERIDLEGDVHKINASYFFGIPITMKEKIKEVRNSVKTVIFGLIYQQGDNGLAQSTGQTVEKIRELKAKFLERFPVGLKWFDKIKNHARKHLFVESPLGRRRHLWSLMLPKDYPEYSYVTSTQERRAVNSPVQGFGSDLMMIGIRNINRMMFEHYEETGHYPDMHLSVSVHDSVTVECGYEDIWLALDLIERGLTSEVVKQVEDRYGFDFISTPEIDFEIGATEKHVDQWDFSYKHMGQLIRSTLETQRDELKYDIDVEEAYNTIMEMQYATMPEWMKKQLWSNKIKIKSMGDDVRTPKERKTIAQYLKELPGNIKKMEQAAKEAEKSGSTISDSRRRSIKKAIAKANAKRRALRKFREQKAS